MRNKLIIELLGAFFLGCAVLMAEGPWMVAALLTALLYVGSPISGAHYNPAVTLAVWLRGRLGWKQSLAYFAAQAGGALLSAVVVGALLGYDHEQGKDALASLGDSAFAGALGSSVAEVLGTFLLTLAFLLTTTSRLTAGNSYFGIVVALAYLGAVGAFSSFNPVLNPANGLAFSLHGLTSALLGEGTDAGVVAKEVIYLAKVTPRLALDLASQLLGAAAAAGLFRLLYPEDR